MFTQARIKLTAFYTLIIAVVLVVFSLLLINYTAQHIRDNVEEDSPNHDIESTVAENAIDQIQHSVVTGDIIVVVLAGLLGYFLAGKTLRPIKVALDRQELFSSYASHELRTPLSVVKTDLEVFMKNKQPTIQDAHALASRSLEEIDRLNGMVENLLVLARSKKADKSVEFDKVIDVSKLIHTVVNKLRPSAEAKQLSIITHTDTKMPIWGNERLLEQLFFNLIQNAITYTQKGSITIKTSPVSQGVIISVTDTGIGIAPEDLPKVFEPFYKADVSRNASIGGVGLGLSVVKEIVERHRGSINIASHLNKGTTITIKLSTLPPELS